MTSSTVCMFTTWAAYIFLLACGLLVFIYQYRKSVARRQRLTHRIVVNGTRGKSSTTRLITAGLRAGLTVPVLGKTTGTQARWLLPNGTEQNITRHAPANIREMNTGLLLAEKLRAKAYVAECMAITPEYQKIIEQYWMQSHVVVITNIRPDHEDVLGEGLPAVAKALSSSLPEKGLLVTTAEAAALLQQVCNFPCDRIRIADPHLGQTWLPQFREPVIPENLSLALTACDLIGVPPEKAITGMLTAAADPGNLEVMHVIYNGHPLTFVGAFAANDPVSTMHIAQAYAPQPGTLKGLWLHARADRRHRTLKLCEALKAMEPDFVIFSGDTEFLKKQWHTLPVPLGMFCLPLVEEDELTAVIDTLPISPVWILGAGNTKGIIPQTLGDTTVCQRLS